jgi:peptide deformylase
MLVNIQLLDLMDYVYRVFEGVGLAAKNFEVQNSLLAQNMLNSSEPSSCYGFSL